MLLAAIHTHTVVAPVAVSSRRGRPQLHHVVGLVRGNFATCGWQARECPCVPFEEFLHDMKGGLLLHHAFGMPGGF